MAKLSTASRNALPDSAFAGPSRSYPVPDMAHATNAKARATQAVKGGHLSPAVASHIVAKANHVLSSGHPVTSITHSKNGR
jgi:hypothetical protein